jgi:glycosyltransferase involved in cell wall biosynthesis
MRHEYSGRPRVGLDAGALMLHERAPGTARFVREQAQELLSRTLPWDWVVAVPAGYGDTFAQRPGCDIVELPGRRYSFFALVRTARLWRQRQCAAAFSPAGMASLFAPVLCNYFDSSIFEYGDKWIESGNGMRVQILKWIARDAFRRSCRVFVNSSYCADYLKSLFPAYSQKFMANPAVLKASLSEPERPGWATADMDRRGLILCSSVFSENKNQRRLIEAYGLLQQAGGNWPPLVLIGHCPPAYLQTRIEPARNGVLRPNEIILAGYVSEPALAWALANAKLLVQPSFAEGFSSLAVFQAMQAGVPVACANTTSHPEAVGSAAVLFDPASVPDMAEAMARLLDNPDLRARLQRDGKLRAAELTWKANGDLVCEEIANLLDRHQAKRDNQS